MREMIAMLLVVEVAVPVVVLVHGITGQRLTKLMLAAEVAVVVYFPVLVAQVVLVVEMLQV